MPRLSILLLLTGILTGIGANAMASTDNSDSLTDMRYIKTLPADKQHPWVIDTRPQSQCMARSLQGAHCLAPEAFFGPHGRLANIRNIAWVFGTARLSGSETVWLVGNDPRRRDVVAALLHLAGQAQVNIVTEPMRDLLANSSRATGNGEIRGLVRSPVYQARTREDQWLLRDDVLGVVRQANAPRILDGRSSDEYYGGIIRARRGGHIPGAELAGARQLRADLEAGRHELSANGPVIAYAQDPYSGLAYLTLLRAGLGINARLYVNGWREWANNGQLPVDAATYAKPADESATALTAPLPWPRLALLLTALLVAGTTGYLFGRRTR